MREVPGPGSCKFPPSPGLCAAMSVRELRLQPERVREALARLNALDSLKVVLTLARERGLEVYLVGGTVRDLLLGGEGPDLDMAVSRETLSLGREVAQALSGVFVLLNEEHHTARVVLKDHMLDLAEFRGPDLTADLRGRDFTINAIALDLRALLAEGRVLLIDPLGGCEDLAAGVIRMVSPDNLAADPLRLLRAYRFAATLGFTVTQETAAAIQRYAPEVARVAGERIHYELFRLLAAPRAAPTVRELAAVGLLFAIFPELADTWGVAQNGYHHLDVFHHSLETLDYLEAILNDPQKFFRGLAPEIASLAADPQRAALLKVAALFHDVGKPKVQEWRQESERYTFYDHDRVGVEIFQSLAPRLRFSHTETRFICQLISWHMRPFLLLPLFRQGQLTIRALGRLVKAAKDELPACFALALADSMAGRGPLKPPDADRQLVELAEAAYQFSRQRDKEAKRPRLISGDDLLALGLKPGPEFRRLLQAVEEAQWEGEIKTREEALALVKRLL